MPFDEPTAWPNETALLELLLPWKGARGFEISMRDNKGRALGNHGDALMYDIYREISGCAGLEFVTDVRQADVLVIPPSGALLDVYGWPKVMRERLNELPDIPLVIFPSSAYFRSMDPGEMFDSRTARTLWILREEDSYRHLQNQWGSSLTRASVDLEVDHDVVAAGHRRVTRLLRRYSSVRHVPDSVLVAARLDVEAGSFSDRPIGTSSFGRRIGLKAFLRLPVGLQRRIRRQVVAARQREASSALLEAVRPMATFDTQTIATSLSRDISDPTMVDFRDYAQAILMSDIVVTNRLHVALPSAAVGNTTFLVDSGYHKLRGVYERSLSGVSNVHFVSRA